MRGAAGRGCGRWRWDRRQEDRVTWRGKSLATGSRPSTASWSRLLELLRRSPRGPGSPAKGRGRRPGAGRGSQGGRGLVSSEEISLAPRA